MFFTEILPQNKFHYFFHKIILNQLEKTESTHSIYAAKFTIHLIKFMLQKYHTFLLLIITLLVISVILTLSILMLVLSS